LPDVLFSTDLEKVALSEELDFSLFRVNLLCNRRQEEYYITVYYSIKDPPLFFQKRAQRSGEAFLQEKCFRSFLRCFLLREMINLNIKELKILTENVSFSAPLRFARIPFY
jgi:hypothetical protein